MRSSAASPHLILNFFNNCCDSVPFCFGQPFHHLQDIAIQYVCSLPGNLSHDEVRNSGPETVRGFYRAEWIDVTQAVHAHRISAKFMTALVRVPS